MVCCYLSVHSNEGFGAGLDPACVFHAVIGIDLQNRYACFLERPNHGLHQEGLAELQTILDNAVSLILLHHLSNMRQPARIRGEDGAIDLEATILDGMHERQVSSIEAVRQITRSNNERLSISNWYGQPHTYA